LALFFSLSPLSKGKTCVLDMLESVLEARLPSCSTALPQIYRLYDSPSGRRSTSLAVALRFWRKTQIPRPSRSRDVSLVLGGERVGIIARTGGQDDQLLQTD